MLRIMQQSDRPTNNTLVYLTKVRPHPIRRHEQLRDPYVEEALSDLLGYDIIDTYKEYTRSFYTLEGHYRNLWLYDRPFVPKIQDPVYNDALEHTRAMFTLPSKVRSIAWDALDTVPFISTSSSGWGYKGKKGQDGNHEIAIHRAVGNLLSWTEKQPSWRYTPDMAWTRTQLGTFESPKIRNVWGKAFHNIILEGMTAYPLISAYQQWSRCPMVVGDHLYKSLASIIHEVFENDDEYNIGIGIDFKSFDSTPQPWLINDAFDILKQNIEFTDEHGALSFEYSRQHFIDTPVIMPDGRMWLKRLGIPSGSYFTQLIGSVINFIVISYIQLKIWKRPFHLRVLGDDSAFGIPISEGYPDINLICKTAMELDFTVHPDKVTIAGRPDQLEFLGHVPRGLRLDRDTAKLLRLALFPEHPVDNPVMSISRMKGLLIDSAMSNWPIINLLKWMILKYGSEGGSHFTKSEKDWLEVIVNVKLAPEEIDLVKAWTLT